MGISVEDLGIGVKIITPDYFEDHRGYYSETYSRRHFRDAGISLEFCQDNHSFTKQAGTIRGIHFQNLPQGQTKLVRCTSGRVIDYVVDLRKDSINYKKWVSVELSAGNRRQILIPVGFGHAFETLEDNCEVLYKVDSFYAPPLDRAIAWNDPDIGITWTTLNPILSEKDRLAPFLLESDVNF